MVKKSIIGWTLSAIIMSMMGAGFCGNVWASSSPGLPDFEAGGQQPDISTLSLREQMEIVIPGQWDECLSIAQNGSRTLEHVVGERLELQNEGRGWSNEIRTAYNKILHCLPRVSLENCTGRRLSAREWVEASFEYLACSSNEDLENIKHDIYIWTYAPLKALKGAAHRHLLECRLVNGVVKVTGPY